MKKIKIRGFLLKQRITVLVRRFLWRVPLYSGYHRLDSSSTCKDRSRSISRIISWGHRLKTKAKAIMCSKNPGLGYKQIGQESFDDQGRNMEVPKGHLAVYVGQKDGGFQRVLVPLIYFNHPLFGELLKETEEEYGFNHPGGITIPCRMTEFESVQSQIKAGHRSLKTLRSKRLL